MEQRFKFQDSEGRRVSAVLLSPSVRTDKVVILCHGFMGHTDSVTNRMLSDHLARQSISTLRFDFFGHGQSDGDIKDLLLTTIVAQTESALSLMQGHGFTRVGLLGSSFGGLVATLVAAKAPVVAALALRCPIAETAPSNSLAPRNPADLATLFCEGFVGTFSDNYSPHSGP